MNEAAPISWLIQEIHNALASGAVSASAGIANAITPLVAVCFGIYIILITFNYLRGAESEPVLDFGIRCAGFAVVIGLGLNASNYASIVIPIVTGLGGDLANAISGGAVTESSLDTLALHYIKIIDDGFEATDGLLEIGASILVALKALIIMLGLVPFLIVATLAIIVADVGSLMIAMVGPFFFACLIFPATRQYFSAWVNSAISYAFIPLFVSVIATLSVSLSTKMLSGGGGGLNESSFKMVFLSAIGNLLLLLLINTVSALASSLSAGGINVGLPRGVGSMASAIRTAGKESAKDVRSIGAAKDGAKSMASNLRNRFNSIRKAG